MLSNQRHSASGPVYSVLALPIYIVYNQSMYESAIPDMWRAANISPLYKGKAKRRAPDSILSAPYKFLERFVCCQIQSFWLGNNIICNEQHGIRPCRSTATNECDAIISNILNSVHSCDVLNQIKSNKKVLRYTGREL